MQLQLCYDECSFAVALMDTDYWKFIAFLDDEPAGLILATNNLDKASVAYVNPEFLRTVEPDACREGRFYYFTCVAIHPDHHGQHHLFYLLVENIAKFIDGVDGLVGLDSSNETGAMIPMIIHQAGLKAVERNELNGTPEYKCVGGQSYFIHRFTKPSED